MQSPKKCIKKIKELGNLQKKKKIILSKSIKKIEIILTQKAFFFLARKREKWNEKNFSPT